MTIIHIVGNVDWRQKIIVVRVEDKPFLDRLMIENDRNICGKKVQMTVIIKKMI